MNVGAMVPEVVEMMGLCGDDVIEAVFQPMARIEKSVKRVP